MMRRKIMTALLSCICVCATACGSAENASNTQENVTTTESESDVKENNDTVGAAATDLSTPVTKIEFNGDSTKNILALSSANGLYGIGDGSYGEFGMEADELSSITLVAKDVTYFNSNIQYIDTNGDCYWSGLWYEGGVKTTFEKIDTNIRGFASISLASVSVTNDNKMKFYNGKSSNMTNLNEELIQELEVVENVKYPLIGYYCTGYVTTDGDVYMKNRKEETKKILSGVTKHEPICDYGRIYLLTDDGVFYSYELEGDNTKNDIVLFQIDTDVVSFSENAYIKSNGDVYTFDETDKHLLTENFAGVDMSNVKEVVYEWVGEIIYISNDDKIVYIHKDNDLNLVNIDEFPCTLGGVQTLYNKLQ